MPLTMSYLSWGPLSLDTSSAAPAETWNSVSFLTEREKKVSEIRV